jgi:hypothetical protein
MPRPDAVKTRVFWSELARSRQEKSAIVCLKDSFRRAWAPFACHAYPLALCPNPTSAMPGFDQLAFAETRFAEDSKRHGSCNRARS